MKIVHIFPCQKFTEGYIKHIFELFDRSEHHFILYGNPIYLTGDLNDYKNNITYCRRTSRITTDKDSRKWLQIADKLIMHSYFENSLAMLLPFKHKICIVFWGGDLYEFRKPVDSFKRKLARYIKKYVISKVNSVATLLPGDYKILSQYCKVPAKKYLAMYAEPIDLIEKQEKIRSIQKSQSPYYLIVGNSGSPENLHIDALKMLEKYREEDIQILVPLSYGGTKEYVNSVIEFGRNLFQEKFLPLTKFMSLDEYWNILNKCVVGIFNNNRQQAMGNINALAFFGAKIYIRSDTVMWDAYTNQRKMFFSDVNDIVNLSFKDFLCFSAQKAKDNYVAIKNATSSEQFLKLWKTIFET